MKLFIIICVYAAAVRENYSEKKGDILDEQPVTDATDDSGILRMDRYEPKEDISIERQINDETDEADILGYIQHLTEINHDTKNDSLIMNELDLGEKELQDIIREQRKETEKDELFANNEVSRLTPARFTFNRSSAHCYHPKEKSITAVWKMWDFEYTDYYSAYINHKCYDKYGVGYKVHDYHTDCCGCMKYRCTIGSRRNKLDQNIYYTHWYLASISASCCQDCHGSIFPANQVMKIDFLDDECSTEVTSVCTDTNEFGNYNSLVAKTYKSNGCCYDESGNSVVGTVKLDPITCSQKYCVLGKPSFWLESPIFPGECKCCEFNGTLVTDGGVVTVEPGLNATCCDGKMVVDYGVYFPPNCSDPEAIHRTLAFCIDRTEPDSDRSPQISHLTNSLIAGVEKHGYKIPAWILTTFNGFFSNVNTTLVIETTDTEEMRGALNDITYSTGGRHVTSANVLEGLLLTLNRLPKHGMIIVFTDGADRHLDLEDQLIALRNIALAKIYFVLTPYYFSTCPCSTKISTSASTASTTSTSSTASTNIVTRCECDPSWKVYENLSKGKIYNMEYTNRTEFLNDILLEIGKDCERAFE